MTVKLWKGMTNSDVRKHNKPEMRQIDGKTKPIAIVLGANAGQADLIRYLTEKGWRVRACSRLANEPGAKIATSFVELNVTEVDQVCALAEAEQTDVVYSVASDIAITAVTAVSERLDLPHFLNSELVAMFRNKAMLRGYLNEHGIGSLDYLKVSSVEDSEGWSTFPCVVKPLDSWGQRGVRKVQDKVELIDAIYGSFAYTASRSAIVEAYMAGTEISCNVLVSEGVLVVAVFSERLAHGDEYFGIPIGHLIPPLHVSDEDIRRAYLMVEAVIRSLGIENAALYFQMIVSDDGPRIVEVAPRLDGCHIWRLIKAAYNIDLIDLTFCRLMGEAIEVPLLRREPEAVYELIFQQLPTGRKFEECDFPVPADALYHEFRYEEGHVPAETNGRLEIVGYYIRQQ